MHDRHAAAPAARRPLPVIGAALLAAGALGAATLFLGASAQAKTPTPSYHKGSDTATFTVTGVLDRNCLVSVGGNKIYIKPGDSIDFKSSLAGIDVTGLANTVNGTLGSLLSHLTGSEIAGLNVSAVLDAKSKHPTKFSVPGGKTTTIRGLSAGTHTLNWTATSAALVPGALGGKATVPLYSSALRSGAKTSWAGNTYVTSGAPDCRLSVSTPKVDVSAGPAHITIPGVTVNTPVDPKKVVGNLNPTKKSSTTKSTTKKQTTTGSQANAQGLLATGKNGMLPVPSRVVPGGYGSTSYGGGGGFYGSSLQGAAGSSGYAPLTMTNPNGTTTTLGSAPSADQQQAKAAASSKQDEPSAQLPVVLAIIAIIALALVASTYARLFLLRRQS